jgi:hypothetical protein
VDRSDLEDEFMKELEELEKKYEQRYKPLDLQVE